MRYRTLGGTGFEVSVVAVGTWAMGGKDYGRVYDGDSIKAVHRAIDLGVNLFDTAPIYGAGHAEEVLGRALDGVRKDVFIATKCGPDEVRPGLLRVDLSRDGIAAQCDASLKRLRTDWIDLLQVHWSDPAYPVEDAVAAMIPLVEAGKVRAIGVCNFTAAELSRALDAAPVAALQPPFNLFRRDAEQDLLPLCREKGLGFLAYEPLARGMLTGKFQDGVRFDPGDIRATDPSFKGERLRVRVEASSRLATLARREGMTPAQLAIAWVLSRPGVTTALCGAKTATQAAENARAAEIDPPKTVLERAEGICAL